MEVKILKSNSKEKVHDLVVLAHIHQVTQMAQGLILDAQDLHLRLGKTSMDNKSKMGKIKEKNKENFNSHKEKFDINM